jgi:hypothetical protein
VGRDGCDGDIDGEGGGEGGSGGFEAQGDVGGPAEWVLWDEVGRFHERVEFAVDETSDRASLLLVMNAVIVVTDECCHC